ncbi:hypothetical protein V6N12_062151 [Hibiscus sabdariffa]|uniref:Uncharacterized protein n=1 Tax=Hibiscus sabdariffa TaxID=183260 RepID=A0ABR2F803_9ROSI
MIDVVKIAILKNCALGFSRRPYRIAELEDKFRKAGLNGFSIMRVTGSMIILMFDDEDKRKEVLAAGVLDEWIENLGTWIPSMPILNRQAIGPKCDCCCELLEGSQASSEQDDNEEIVENKERREIKSVSPMPMETVVPDSIQSQAVKSMELVRMWEGNMQLDLRVRDTASWMAEEDIGIIDRDEEQRCNAMDLSVECEFSEVRQVILDDKSVATSPINRGPQDRAKLAVVIEYGGSRERWEVEDLRCGIIGLYAPCIVTQQTEFWEKVELIILEKDVAWCVGVILTWLGVWKRDEVV